MMVDDIEIGDTNSYLVESLGCSQPADPGDHSNASFAPSGIG